MGYVYVWKSVVINLFVSLFEYGVFSYPPKDCVVVILPLIEITI
jgi:hypothetical protein